jgi:pSer/pThr/pTyr-binding forkhead associated (FHA) protein
MSEHAGGPPSERRSSAGSARTVHIVVEHPHALPRLVAIDSSPILVGRGPDCTIALDDDQVSREHAQFVVRDDRVLVRDLGSRNGTYVNGAVIVGDVAIGDDDLVTIGRARLAVRRNWTAAAAISGT